MMGDDPDLAKEFTYLGRLATWNFDMGIQVQPDRRHVQRLLKDLGLEQTQGVQSPWAVNNKLDKGEEVVDIRQRRDERPEMEPRAARRRRTNVARVVYIAQDRLDQDTYQ